MKFPSDFLLNPPRNVDGERNARLVFRDVQKGFIQGKGFHQICVTVENGVYLRGDGLVHIHAVAGEAVFYCVLLKLANAGYYFGIYGVEGTVVAWK